MQHEIKTIKDVIIEDIVTLTKQIKIKSFSFNDIVIDFQNIHEYEDKLYDKDSVIKVSNKYIPLLKYKFNDLKEFMTSDHNFHMINNKEKHLSFNITNHASIQLLRRMLYIYIKSDKFEWSSTMKTFFIEHLDDIIALLKESKNIKDFSTNEFLSSTIELLLYNATVFNPDNVGRDRDRLAFARRDKKNQGTIRYFNHPFMFIVQEGILKTVELYSSSEDCRHFNKETSDDRTFNRWFKQFEEK